MFEFNRYDPRGKAVTYEFPVTPSIGKLQIIHAGRTNKAFTNAVAHRALEAGRQGRTLDADTLQQGLDQDRELFPLYVIRGWSGVKDSKNKPVKFNQADCARFLKALPDWLMADLSRFAQNPRNFIEEGIDDVVDDDAVGETAGK